MKIPVRRSLIEGDPISFTVQLLGYNSYVASFEADVVRRGRFHQEGVLSTTVSNSFHAFTVTLG